MLSKSEAEELVYQFYISSYHDMEAEVIPLTEGYGLRYVCAWMDKLGLEGIFEFAKDYNMEIHMDAVMKSGRPKIQVDLFPDLFGEWKEE